MTRYWFGGGVADWTFTQADGVAGFNDLAQVVGGVNITLWNAETGGTQYIDLLDASGSAITSVTSSDGSDGRAPGTIPPFQGPDGVTELWASAGAGPRSLLQGRLGQQVATNTTQLASHIAQANGHGTGLGDLVDVTVPAPGSRNVGDVVGVVTGGGFGMVTPSQAAGAVLLNPPLSGGSYVGNTATPPLSSQGQNGQPWLKLQQPYSSTDDNPDAIQLLSTTAGGTAIKTNWANGNGEGRRAPSTVNRIADRVFEYAEGLGGPSTGRFVEWSTNPTNAANREPLLGGYGTGHSSKPGWVEATRVLSGLLGVRAGGSYNGLTGVNFRGQRATTGAPTSGTWAAGDVVLDSAGSLYLCTVAGTPGTWVTASGGGANEAGPTTFVDITPGTGMAHGTTHAATRLERGGDAARLRGTLTATAAVASGAVIATIPTTAHRPLHGVTTIARYTGGGNKFDVATDGTITYQAAFTSGQSIWLDSITWDLSA